MNKFIIAGIVGVLQIILSIVLIVRKKNKWAIISEIISSLVLFYYLNEFSIEVSTKLGMYIIFILIEYLIVKVFLVVFMLIARYCSFYIIKAACRKKKKTNSVKIKFARIFSKTKYWPNLKLGLPGMAGKTHSKTKVKFDEKGFPKFKVYTSVKLRRKYWHQTRERHFYMANKILYESICRGSRVSSKFTKTQIFRLSQGMTPEGYTWHHHQDAGVLQLVDEDIHSKTFHIGGYTIWGGK